MEILLSQTQKGKNYKFYLLKKNKTLKKKDKNIGKVFNIYEKIYTFIFSLVLVVDQHFIYDTYTWSHLRYKSCLAFPLEKFGVTSGQNLAVIKNLQSVCLEQDQTEFSCMLMSQEKLEKLDCLWCIKSFSEIEFF